MAYGLYLHIPFCRSRCNYCNFHSQAARQVPNTYIQALLRDFEHYAPQGVRPHTVYFGGGTPGLLAPAQVARILQAVAPQNGAEVTLELNPEGVSAEALAAWRAAGVNRLSFGVQTACDASLKRLGRRHTAAQARTALQNARAAGFSNISGDIMLALPGYTFREFDETLALLAGADVSHISAYILKTEQGTPFGARPPQGLPGAEQQADFYLYAVEALQKAGYAQYEISNFARPGFESRHNLVYWNCEDYLGLGPSAHSCMQSRRFSFAPDTPAYINGPLPPQAQGECTAEDFIMLQLRLAKGLNLGALAKNYGVSLTTEQLAFCKQLKKEGLAQGDENQIFLTPRGMLVQNAILARLLA